MAYAVGSLPAGAERITNIEMTWKVGAQAKRSFAFYSTWFGIDPGDNLFSLRSLNGWAGFARGWSMETRYHKYWPWDWRSSRGYAAEAGQTLHGSIAYDESSDSYTIKQTIVETNDTTWQVVKCRHGEKFTVPYVVYEKVWHCGSYPPDGRVTFTDIKVECDGQDCTSKVQWEAKFKDDNCNMRAHVESPTQISITWDTSAPSAYDSVPEAELIRKNSGGWAAPIAAALLEQRGLVV